MLNSKTFTLGDVTVTSEVSSTFQNLEIRTYTPLYINLQSIQHHSKFKIMVDIRGMQQQRDIEITDSQTNIWDLTTSYTRDYLQEYLYPNNPYIYILYIFGEVSIDYTVVLDDENSTQFTLTTVTEGNLKKTL